MDSSQLDRVISERDKLREAINKIAGLRQQEVETQKTLRSKAEKCDKLTAENERLQAESKEQTEHVKLVSNTFF